MSQPELQDDDGSGDGGVVADFDGTESESDDGSDVVAVGEADLGLDDDNGIVDGFDGFEAGSDTSDDTTSSSSGSSGGGGSGPSVASAIEEGMAEVAAIGLTGQERQRVRSEMQAVASKFKLGYFGEQCVEKYLKKDIEEIPPEYGLAAALVAFLAITVYKRPDGPDKAKQAFTAVKSKVMGGDSAAPDPEPDAEPAEDDDTSEDDDDE